MLLSPRRPCADVLGVFLERCWPCSEEDEASSATETARERQLAHKVKRLRARLLKVFAELTEANLRISELTVMAHALRRAESYTPLVPDVRIRASSLCRDVAERL